MTIDATNLRAADLGIDGDDEPVLDVLDLPQLYTKPPASALLTVLEDLSYEPPSWETTPHSRSPRSRSGTSSPLNKPKNGGPLLRKKPKVRSEGLPRYLTRIIASPLAWIADEDEKEKVWEAAAKRLSERSGRTGMGALWRRLGIPLKKAAAAKPVGTELKADEDRGVMEVDHVVTDTIPVTNSTAQDGSHTGRSEGDEDDEVLSIHLHEPALTADNLGLKTWASSYLLAKRLVLLHSDKEETDFSTTTNPPAPQLLPVLPPDAEILELGSGTGLVGMAAARVLQRKVWLTDLEGIVGNLERNVRGNWKVVAGLSRESGSDEKEAVERDEGEVAQMMRRERMETAVLDWSDPLNVVVPGRRKQSQREGEEEAPILLSPTAAPIGTIPNGSSNPREHEKQADDTLLKSSAPQPTTWNPNTFPLILAADPIYSPDHPTLLTTAIRAHLTLHSPLSRVLVEMPIREGFASEREDFRSRMEGLGLRVLGQGEEVGYDDWGSGGEDGRSFTEVRCWWSVWGWG
ncbi:hypothetical protein KC332_g9423 [Hortaea werneckii]|uniref:Uncharacterized protein n=1 Tax=Hortaea werneckii TaxID=91943 RepID=A0A3M7I5L8_HORWE|nr:hypothetical protein KC358_g9190 [Hortaea werneckii]KAI6848702.1 hypothetical protein KC350_g2903 [Hortaea werneckii]KAI6923288.1 hypothetical protein KC348_g9555 [Hortaea werneckii]KAI6932418.1 hypothetical protein KC341_g8968 [Hortaea werneckii]KAI6954948.1 hypothetical protein KC321_g16054 [Hortaea werneckii]